MKMRFYTLLTLTVIICLAVAVVNVKYVIVERTSSESALRGPSLTGETYTTNMAVVFQRMPHMKVTPDDHIVRGDPVHVTIYMDKDWFHPGESGLPVMVSNRLGVANLSIAVWLAFSDDFIIGEESVKTLNVDTRSNESGSVQFKLQVRDDANATTNARIAAYFVFDGHACGRIERTLTVSSGSSEDSTHPSATSTVTSSAVSIIAGGPKPDLCVFITHREPENDGQHFQCQVVAPRLPAYAKGVSSNWNLAKQAFTIVNEDMKEFSTNRSDRKGLNQLVGAGVTLFKQAPDTFKDAYWKLLDGGSPPTNISVVSEEPYIPWELMIPSRTQHGTNYFDDLPLGARYRIARWLPGDFTPAPTDVALDFADILAPEYENNPLPTSSNEVAFLLSIFPGERIHPADYDHIDDFFALHNGNLLHFIGHGTGPTDIDGNAVTPGRQLIYVEGDDAHIDSEEVLGMRNIRRYCSDNRPFIFLNSCQVGQNAPGLIGVAGFPATFIQLQASAIVAPLWSVDDDIATEVAEEFYAALAANPDVPFSEVLRQIRRKAYEGPTKGKTSFAAYCLYGDPFASRMRKSFKL